MCKVYTHRCWFCGKEFKTDDIDQDYCSVECFHANEDSDDMVNEEHFMYPDEIEVIP